MSLSETLLTASLKSNQCCRRSQRRLAPVASASSDQCLLSSLPATTPITIVTSNTGQVTNCGQAFHIFALHSCLLSLLYSDLVFLGLYIVVSCHSNFIYSFRHIFTKYSMFSNGIWASKAFIARHSIYRLRAYS